MTAHTPQRSPSPRSGSSSSREECRTSGRDDSYNPGPYAEATAAAAVVAASTPTHAPESSPNNNNNHPDASPSGISSFPPSGRPEARPGGRDVSWLLNALRPFGVTSATRAEAGRWLKYVCEKGSKAFWEANAAQIVSALLEPFNPTLLQMAAMLPPPPPAVSTTPSAGAGAGDGQTPATTGQDKGLGLTGLTPQTQMGSQTGSASAGSLGSAGRGSESPENQPAQPSQLLGEAMLYSCRCLLLLARTQGRFLVPLLDVSTSLPAR